MNDGIYTCDVNDYRNLLSSQDGKTIEGDQDWFFWWLKDNGIDYKYVEYVCYNELQQTIYVSEVDGSNQKMVNGKTRIRYRRKDTFTMNSYPSVEPLPQILQDRWDWLMEEVRGDERAICQAG